MLKKLSILAITLFLSTQLIAHCGSCGVGKSNTPTEGSTCSRSTKSCSSCDTPSTVSDKTAKTAKELTQQYHAQMVALMGEESANTYLYKQAKAACCYKKTNE